MTTTVLLFAKETRFCEWGRGWGMWPRQQLEPVLCPPLLPEAHSPAWTGAAATGTSEALDLNCLFKTRRLERK